MLRMARTTLGAPRGFSLAATAGFLRAFAPAGHAGERPERLELAFVPDGESRAAGVALSQDAAGGLELAVTGEASPAAASRQAARMLGLDLDDDAFAALGRGDPVLSRLQKRLGGLRPAAFCSPWEAAVFFLLSQRSSMRQASAVMGRLREEHGERVEVAGAPRRAFPAPARIARLGELPGVPARKCERIRGLAAAAEEGRLDGARLRELETADAIADLRELPGVGPFTAEGILIRGAGAPDVLPMAEPRLRRAVRLAYDLPREPDDAELRSRAERWRPFRAWVAVLLRAAAER